MPRATAPVLRRASYAAEDVRDVGLGGHNDSEVFRYAQDQGAVLITGDRGFANIVEFVPGTHAGIVVLRLPNDLPVHRRIEELMRALAFVEGQDLTGTLVVVQVGRTRVRRLGDPTVIGP